MDITILNENTEEESFLPSQSFPLRNSEEIISNQHPVSTKKICFNVSRLFKFSDRTLRLIFLIFIGFIGVTSFSTALMVGSTFFQFKQQCLLYASFQYQSVVTQTSNWTIRIVPLTERFSSQSACDFCTFFNVFTFIYCIMTGFFFILFNGDPQIMTTNDRCLIIPWFPISCILTFFSLISSAMLTNGFLKFCSTIKSNGNKNVHSCALLNEFYFEQYPSVSSLYVNMLLSIIASWFQLAFFIGILAVLTIRISSSFDWKMDDRVRKNRTREEIPMISIDRR